MTSITFVDGQGVARTVHRSSMLGRALAGGLGMLGVITEVSEMCEMCETCEMHDMCEALVTRCNTCDSEGLSHNLAQHTVCAAVLLMPQRC